MKGGLGASGCRGTGGPQQGRAMETALPGASQASGPRHSCPRGRCVQPLPTKGDRVLEGRGLPKVAQLVPLGREVPSDPSFSTCQDLWPLQHRGGLPTPLAVATVPRVGQSTATR